MVWGSGTPEIVDAHLPNYGEAERGAGKRGQLSPMVQPIRSKRVNEIETFEFDRQGYIVIENLLNEDPSGPRWPRPLMSWKNTRSRTSPSRRANKAAGEPTTTPIPSAATTPTASGPRAKTLIIEDYWNANPAFDVFARPPADDELHPRHRQTAAHDQQPPRSASATVATPPAATAEPLQASQKVPLQLTLTTASTALMVRMVLFHPRLHQRAGSPFVWYRGLTKTNLPSPHSNDPDEDPDMIGLEVKAGDAILFTENLRHGGLHQPL